MMLPSPWTSPFSVFPGPVLADSPQHLNEYECEIFTHLLLLIYVGQLASCGCVRVHPPNPKPTVCLAFA